MGQIHKFRDQPDWQEVRRNLKELGLDPNQIAEFGEQQGGSLDLVTMTMALEEAFAEQYMKKRNR